MGITPTRRQGHVRRQGIGRFRVPPEHDAGRRLCEALQTPEVRVRREEGVIKPNAGLKDLTRRPDVGARMLQLYVQRCFIFALFELGGSHVDFSDTWRST